MAAPSVMLVENDGSYYDGEGNLYTMHVRVRGAHGASADGCRIRIAPEHRRLAARRQWPRPGRRGGSATGRRFKIVDLDPADSRRACGGRAHPHARRLNMSAYTDWVAAVQALGGQFRRFWPFHMLPDGVTVDPNLYGDPCAFWSEIGLPGQTARPEPKTPAPEFEFRRTLPQKPMAIEQSAAVRRQSLRHGWIHIRSGGRDRRSGVSMTMRTRPRRTPRLLLAVPTALDNAWPSWLRLHRSGTGRPRPSGPGPGWRCWCSITLSAACQRSRSSNPQRRILLEARDFTGVLSRRQPDPAPTSTRSRPAASIEQLQDGSIRLYRRDGKPLAKMFKERPALAFSHQ